MVSGFILKVSKKIIEKLYRMGAFEILRRREDNLAKANVSRGKNTDINSSAIFITQNKGVINLQGNNYVGRNTELQTDGTISIGFGTSIQDRNIILGDVEIGSFCLTAPNVYMSSGRHHFELEPNLYIKDQDAIVLNDAELYKSDSKKITIEDDVWIGINSVIMPGTTIGRGSIIGSNSVVTKNVEPFSVMAGAPAKLIKKRLELKPLTELSFDRNDHLPNFYRGLNINLQNLNEDRAQGGISANHSFILYLNDSGNKIELTVKKITSLPLALIYNGSEITIKEPGFHKIYFNLHKTNFHHFILKTDHLNSTQKNILIKEVKILE